MVNVVDRRNASSNDTYSSRERFIQKNRKAIRKRMEEQISNSDIQDIGKDGVDVTVPKDTMREPMITHGQGGKNKQVMPGNKSYNAGDRQQKPEGGGGGGGNGDPEDGDASPDGEGDDNFVFAISEEEFLQFLYEDLELPNMTKQSAEDINKPKPEREGFVSDGPPNKLDLLRSKKKQMSRHMAFKKPQNKKIHEYLKAQEAILRSYDPDYTPPTEAQALPAQITLNALLKLVEELKGEVASLKEKYSNVLSEEDQKAIESLDSDIEACERKIGLMPKWNEATDLTFRHHEMKPTPTTQAVMFCLMDVSGSMSQEQKNNAKLFYMLLYRFLQRSYEKVDIVFVRHTQHAEEVDEQTFFYDRKSGGTVVSTVLEKMDEIVQERYPKSEWNMYGAQASDGDTWGDEDEQKCAQYLRDILEYVQGYFYTEVRDGFRRGQNSGLWDVYETVRDSYPDKFFMGAIDERKDIFPVFREFFKKHEGYESSPVTTGPAAYQTSYKHYYGNKNTFTPAAP